MTLEERARHLRLAACATQTNQAVTAARRLFLQRAAYWHHIDTAGLVVCWWPQSVIGVPETLPVVNGVAIRAAAEPLFVSLTLPVILGFLASPTIALTAFSNPSNPVSPTYIDLLEATGDATTVTGSLNFNVTYTPVPEPVSLSLLGLGLLGAVVARRKAITAALVHGPNHAGISPAAF